MAAEGMEARAEPEERTTSINTHNSDVDGDENET
jgi:hypothetical protein